MSEFDEAIWEYVYGEIVGTVALDAKSGYVGDYMVMLPDHMYAPCIRHLSTFVHFHGRPDTERSFDVATAIGEARVFRVLEPMGKLSIHRVGSLEPKSPGTD